MHASPLPNSLTFPHGFLDFLTLTPKRGHWIGEHELQAAGLARFNAAMRALSPESPALTLDQMANAAQRALDRYPDGGQPAFVTSRLSSLKRLQALVADAGWDADADLRAQLETVEAYLDARDDLIPDELPVVGRLDDAVLVDVALQLLRDELAEYEDFCRFRQVAADFAEMSVDDTGLTRQHWTEALAQARGSQLGNAQRARRRYAPDPRATLFHVT